MPRTNAPTKVLVKDIIVHHASGPSPTCEERNVSDDNEWGLLKTTAVTWNGWDSTAHKIPPRNFWGNRSIEIRAGDVLITKAGPRNRCGVTVYVPETPSQLMVSGKMILLRPNISKTNAPYLASVLASEEVQRYLDARTTGLADAQLNFTNQLLLNTLIDLPPAEVQAQISEIRTTIDQAIEQTEALIAKTQQIKAGLMHDLFTRGVTPDGQLRPAREDAPQLYKESPLGWIPNEWEVDVLANSYGEPARNGLYKPAQFHGRGPLMIQMGNMFSGLYVGLDGASRVDVTPLELSAYGLRDGDLLFGRRSLVFEGAGRSVLVQNMVEPATFESSIIRVRLDQKRLNPHFAALYLSTEIAYRDRRRFIRQVAVSGVAGSDVKQFKMVLPDPNEQRTIVMLIESAQSRSEENRSELKKLQNIKQGLMSDLLSGRVEVSIGASESAQEVAVSV